ncbi:hypothetical protein C343_05301 [Cryptococcus neoformans C23]|uniref:Uncharacterized protein n=2 Tax=Cryptococcus neoformans TaxID=5207 RepID=A0A854Q513_CRYNE|nr:hypothetical protein CNAG_04446 [Cryptococcus neoformans var. grubii H99]AUB27153.1 hypothetical protein CKF44_04446 [Cryptococcus neoformans var. grubii]OWZ28872.1 hypothetical protein C347_05348 [Cryptococcus neoformans var. grubii AD2-60a]OWZ35174.1 hypothetical protein C353_05198 [Cryptococcus neoformans var. grubii AD1-83a]OWZ40822.1 hypothetical protein C343_05301 [Cryptococcus neoformans var. grubii C23]OXC82627.1 hypothetical protein C344_05025 [Cryptococcus neoformans var. grubii A|eukprot:XP_012051536.1 hypothetical protein CNAG_04446 [Cryptococcus neoformans var. grubii H99]
MAKKEKKKLLTFGPFEQVLLALLVMVFASHPSFPYSPFTAIIGPDGQSTISPFPFLSPPFLAMLLIVYLGYYILRRQEAERDRLKALAKAKPKSFSPSSSSSSNKDKKPLSSSDVRDGKLATPSNKRVGDPMPKHVFGSSKEDPSAQSFRKNYFLTMQGPGRPALVPFQDGLRPKKGEAVGTMWWDNVPDDAKDLMAPPIDKDKLKASLKNPWQAEMLEKDIELLKLAKKQKAEEERYAKVANLLQTMLGFLLCAVDMRLGICLLTFFLWRHFTSLHDADMAGEEDAIEKEKKEITDKIREAKKAGMSSKEMAYLQTALERLA